jgi:type 1 fimbria pilin
LRLSAGPLAAGLVLLAAAAAPAQSPPLQTGTGPDWALKMFSETKHDFGVVARGADIKAKIKITNLYKEDVRIASATPSCSCTTVMPLQKTTLRTHESAEIEFTMDTRRFVRHKDAVITVSFTAPQFADIRIPIQMYVRTDVVLTPGGANFGAVDIGKGATQTIEIAYAGRSDWEIREARANNPHLDVAVEEVNRSGGNATYKLTVALKPTAPPGSFRGMIQLLTDDANNPVVPVLAEARIEADITVTPGTVPLGTLKPGETKTVQVVIRGKKPFTIEKIECDSDDEAFAVRLPEGEKIVHVLPLTVTPPEKPGPYQEVFTVTIPGREEPVTFKAAGRIAAKAG